MLSASGLVTQTAPYNSYMLTNLLNPNCNNGDWKYSPPNGGYYCSLVNSSLCHRGSDGTTI